MKKFLLVALMLLFSLTAFCQDVPSVIPGTILDLLEDDGHTWMEKTQAEKFAFVTGLLTANGAIIITIMYSDFFIFESEEQKDIVIEWLLMPEPVYFTMLRIEAYYGSSENLLDFSIWSVFYYLYERHWWKTVKEKNTKQVRFD